MSADSPLVLLDLPSRDHSVQAVVFKVRGAGKVLTWIGPLSAGPEPKRVRFDGYNWTVVSAAYLRSDHGLCMVITAIHTGTEGTMAEPAIDEQTG